MERENGVHPSSCKQSETQQKGRETRVPGSASQWGHHEDASRELFLFQFFSRATVFRYNGHEISSFATYLILVSGQTLAPGSIYLSISMRSQSKSYLHLPIQGPWGVWSLLLCGGCAELCTMDRRRLLASPLPGLASHGRWCSPHSCISRPRWLPRCL